MKYRLIAFDWDGTLVNSIDHIVKSIKYAAKEMSFEELADINVKHIIGLGMNEAIKELYPDVSSTEIELFKGTYKDAFFSVKVGREHLFPHAEEVLEYFSGEGVKLAVATGKSRRGLDLALKSTGLGSYFDIERCADESLSKPNPLMLHQIMEAMSVDAEEVLMVGDTDFDMDMAKRAGVDRVGVSFGAQKPHRLEVYDPLFIMDSLSQLLSLNKR